MTNLAALQSLTEYSNSALFEKIMLDRGVTAGTDYTGTAAQQKAIDLCYADVCVYLANHPEVTEGSFKAKYTAKDLINTAQALYAKHGVSTAIISGAAIW